MNVKMQIFTNWFELIAFGLAIIVFVGSAITFILSYFIRRIKRRIISIVALVSFVILILFGMAIPGSVVDPGATMGSEYSSALHCIILGLYPAALEALSESKEWAKYVPDDSESEILKSKPGYLGDIDYLISSLDGGSLSASDLQNCINSGDISAVGYLWIKGGQHVILNIYPPGVVYLVIEMGDYGKIADILGEQFEGSNYSIDIKRQKPVFCWKYQSDDCIGNIAKAIALDQFFAYNESSTTQLKGKSSSLHTDYFTISCKGNQINDYRDIDTEGNPPWGNFRQAVLDTVKAALNTGTEITPEQYEQAIKEAEENSQAQTLTGYYFSKTVLSRYQY